LLIQSFEGASNRWAVAKFILKREFGWTNRARGYSSPWRP